MVTSTHIAEWDASYLIDKMYLSVRLDIINTVGVTEDSQKTIKCDAEIFVVAGIWAGYDKEPVSDLSSYSCSEWDETTAYFMVSYSCGWEGEARDSN